MSIIQTCSVNLLEASTVTLTAGTAATGYPLYRLYDRDIGRMFVGSAPVSTTIHVDQGASGNQTVGRCIIPAGHNLAGVSLALDWSTDNVSWTNIFEIVGAAGNIYEIFSGVMRRYWRLRIISPASSPQLAELWLSPVAIWTRNPSRPGGNQDDIHNVTVVSSSTGRPRFEVNGPSLKQRNYTLSNISSAQRTILEEMWSTWAGSKPIWLKDHEGIMIYVRFVGQLNLTEVAPDVFNATFSVIEVPA